MIQAETIEEMEDMIKSEPRAQDRCADTSVRMPVGKPVVDNSTRYGQIRQIYVDEHFPEFFNNLKQ